jgi:RNA polymerase primary sigma factor
MVGSKLSQKPEGVRTGTDTVVVDLDELQSVLDDGSERGFLSADAVDAALEEADLDADQTQELLGYLEDHGIDVLPLREPGLGPRPLEEPSDDHRAERGDVSLPDGADPVSLASPSEDEQEDDEDGQDRARALQSRLDGLKKAEVDLTIEPSLDSLRMYLHAIGRVLCSAPARRSPLPSGLSAAT